MPVKISGIAKLSRSLKRILPDARSKFAREMKASIVDIVVEKITSGVSPVKGQNRYPKYSTEYGKYKGRKQPVDLVDSGKMLNALKAIQKSNGTIILEFTGTYAQKIAAYHQFGEGKMPTRKMLPVKNREVFKAEINKKIVMAAEKAVRESIKNFTKR